MAGEALTTQFMLSSATLMIGPQAGMLDLLPELNSVGLVKNLKIKSAPEFKNLTQGIQNRVVYSVKTGNTTSVSAEVYEYTARNVAYALGLDGGNNVVPTPVSTTLGVASTASAATLTVTLGTGILAGDWILITEPGLVDKTRVRKVLSVAANVLTLTTNLPAAVIPIGSTVAVISNQAVGSNAIQPFFSAKIIGTTAEGKPVGFLFPKIRITNGFDFGFTGDFGNLPFEMSIYDLVPADPHYALFNNQQGMMIGV